MEKKLGRLPIDPEIRFWSLVSFAGDDECWNWKAATARGYGQFALTCKKALKAHRYSWELHNGPIPEGLIILHSCDNPRCVNPNHLSIGTHKDNAADRDQKGRQAIGEHCNKKLTNELVREILRESGSQDSIARKFGISQTHVSRIKRGNTWAHITG